MPYAEVAVDAPSRRTFSYSVPLGMSITVGQAVWVPFGPRLARGVVVDIVDVPAVDITKDIAALADPQPVLTPVQVKLAQWISQHYLSPLFAALSLMMPPGMTKVAAMVHPTDSRSELALSSLTSQKKALLSYVDRRGGLPLKRLRRVFGEAFADTTVDVLARRGLVRKSFQLEKPKVGPKLQRYVRLMIEPRQALDQARGWLEESKSLRQAKALSLLAKAGEPVLLSTLKAEAGISLAQVRGLEKKGMVDIVELRVQRDPLAHRTFTPSPPPRLTAAQEEVWRQINSVLEGDWAELVAPVCLLHGVTGSGKTEIYLRALDWVVSQGKRGLVLVPEIALTPQTIGRFAARFPNRVGVLHSRLSAGEFFDEWQRIRDGDFDVVIGSRGAIFAPQPDLGLIVIDEEHEGTYKQQDQSPRYHTRDVATKLSQLTGCVVILGSATPDVSTYYRAQRGEYQLLRLPQRVLIGEDGSVKEPVAGRLQLPQVEVVDLRLELKEGNRSIFSRSLQEEIRAILADREQAILFLNRRGSATFIQCRDCGFVLCCRRCDVPLAYHSATDSLLCHQCNYRVSPPEVCPHCWSRRIKFLGLGTQRVEEEAAKLFPKARLLRWDRDVTRGRGSHEAIMDRFVAHEADILIGTQMIAKGLDLPLVTLVGVVNADVNLYLPDFRAAERTFQLLTQVAGRAGRRVWGGRVIIQTYAPDNYAIVAASKHDYETFYRQEIEFRRSCGAPPFGQLARLLYLHTNAGHCQREALRVYRLLEQERDSRGLPDIALLGPAPAYIERLRGRFRWQIILRGSKLTDLLTQVPLPQGWSVDVDPVSLL